MTSEVLTPLPRFGGYFHFLPGTTRLLLEDSAQPNHALWDYQTKQVVWHANTKIKSLATAAKAISPDMRRLLLYSYADKDHGFILWDVPTQSEVRRYTMHRQDVRDFAFLPDGKHFISAARDGYALIWEVDPAPGEDPYVNYFKGHEQPKGPFPLTCLAVSSDGRYALTGDEDGYAILWDVESGEDDEGCKAVHRFPRVDSKVHGPPTGKAYFVPKGTGEIKVYRDDHQYGAKITAVAFFPDGSHVVVADNETLVRVFHTGTGKEVARHEQLKPGVQVTSPWISVRSVAVSSDGRHILLASNPYPLLWEWRANQVIELRGHVQTHPNRPGEPGGVHSVAFSPDGKLAITGGEDGTIRLWNVPQ